MQSRFARVYRDYSTRENFLASLGPVVLISSSLPASAHRTKERRTFPTNRGKRNLRDREGDGKRILVKTGKQGNLRGEPEKRRGGRRKLEEDGKERIDKERQPLFAITDRCGLPGLDVRTEGTGLRSDQSFRCASCGTARLIGFGVDSPSKSRVTTSISIESSDIIASSIAQAGRRRSRQDPFRKKLR